VAGICAVFGPDTEQLVRKVCGSLGQRGPDDEVFFIGKNLALEHRALKIANISVPHQPFANEDGMYACMIRCVWSLLP
jgi:asparagine synthetase B (glutamine-hydrolysing)